MIMKIIIVILAACLAYEGGYARAEAAEITVSAALSLKNAFEEIGRLYETKHKAKISFNFGASGDLVKQIAGGAPVDVFASAAEKDMDDAVKQGLVSVGSRTDFASNSVVLVVPVGAKTALNSFSGLTSNEIKRIAIGNPKTAPAGRYAEEVFAYYRVLPNIRDKMIFAENVRQVLDYVARGEVDAGAVYATDAAARSGDVRIAASAPEESHKPVIYSLAVVKGSRNEALSQAFISLVMSAEGRQVLKKHGFRAVK